MAFKTVTYNQSLHLCPCGHIIKMGCLACIYSRCSIRDPVITICDHPGGLLAIKAGLCLLTATKKAIELGVAYLKAASLSDRCSGSNYGCKWKTTSTSPKAFQLHFQLPALSMSSSVCVEHNKLWAALCDLGVPTRLIRCIRSPDTDQEASVRTLHGNTDCFRISSDRDVFLSPFLFILHAEVIRWKLDLDLPEVGEKNGGRTINNFEIHRWYNTIGWK